MSTTWKERAVSTRPQSRYRNLLAIVAGSLLLLVASGSGASATQQNPAAADGRCETVPVRGTTDSLVAPLSVPAGRRTFDVRTTNPDGIILGIFRLDDGKDLDEFLGELRVALTGEGTERTDAGQQVARDSVFVGGINAAPGQRTSFTTTLRPGTYHLIDSSVFFRDSDAEDAEALTAAVQPIEVAGGAGTCPTGAVSTITMVDTAEGPRYLAPPVLRAGEPIRVVNRTRQPDEAVLMPVRPGTDRAAMAIFFAELERGWEHVTEIPFTSFTPLGMPVIHPRIGQVIQPDLQPGDYVLFTWLPDLEEGGSRAAAGMFEMVTVR